MNKDGTSNIQKIFELFEELHSDNTLKVAKIIPTTEKGLNTLSEIYLSYIIQPLLDKYCPRIDIGDGLIQLAGYTKEDHKLILKCFYDHIMTERQDSTEIIDEHILMHDIMQASRGHYNPIIIRNIINEVKKELKHI